MYMPITEFNQLIKNEELVITYSRILWRDYHGNITKESKSNNTLIIIKSSIITISDVFDNRHLLIRKHNDQIQYTCNKKINITNQEIVSNEFTFTMYNDAGKLILEMIGLKLITSYKKITSMGDAINQFI